MYELWGGGAPFRAAANGRDLVDLQGRTVSLLGISDRILHDLRSDTLFAGKTKVAWVSCM